MNIYKNFIGFTKENIWACVGSKVCVILSVALITSTLIHIVTYYNNVLRFYKHMGKSKTTSERKCIYISLFLFSFTFQFMRKRLNFSQKRNTSKYVYFSIFRFFFPTHRNHMLSDVTPALSSRPIQATTWRYCACTLFALKQIWSRDVRWFFFPRWK